MDVIKADNLGLSFRFLKRKKRNVQDSLTGIYRWRREEANRFWALRGVSFTVARGETLGVIGRNGSGKSTLMRVIGGIYRPDEGRITVEGKVSTLLSTGAGFQSELTGVENIYLNGVLLGLKSSEIDELFEKIVDFAELGDFINMPVKTYSSGMYARLGFSIAVNVKEDVLLVDEVLGVGDAKFGEKARKAMEEIMTEGRTIILVSHQMDTVRRFANRVLWLDKGRVMAEGPTDDVVDRYLSS
jgi:ABC-type polysaccharide/polyol phosphate transport system ATPase subunit